MSERASESTGALFGGDARERNSGRCVARAQWRRACAHKAFYIYAASRPDSPPIELTQQSQQVCVLAGWLAGWPAGRVQR